MPTYIFGYARVSTKEQNLDRQLIKFDELGIPKDHVHTDKQSGKNFDRADYQVLRNRVREGDLIYFDALDRLGRDYDGVIAEWKYFTREKKVDIVVLERESLFDSRKYKGLDDMGRYLEDMMLNTLAFVADQERKKLLIRQKEGIAVALAKGTKFGAKRIAIPDEKFIAAYKLVKAGGMTATEAWKSLGLKKATWYRRVGEYESTSASMEGLG